MSNLFSEFNYAVAENFDLLMNIKDLLLVSFTIEIGNIVKDIGEILVVLSLLQIRLRDVTLVLDKSFFESFEELLVLRCLILSWEDDFLNLVEAEHFHKLTQLHLREFDR